MKRLTYFHVNVALACLLTADGLGAGGPDSSTLAEVYNVLVSTAVLDNSVSQIAGKPVDID